MYISSLKLWNYRKYGCGSFDLDKPDLIVPFNKGLNVLIGENDSGKSAIIDAIKVVLKTHAYEWIKIEELDFYKDSKKLRIEIVFKGLKSNEAKNFIEWLGWEGEGENAKPLLRLIYQAERNHNRILYSEVKAGMDENGHALNGESREYLKVTFLKALRDAKTELIAKKNSRLSQILLGHNLFGDEKSKGRTKFEVEFEKVNTEIENWFKKEGKEEIKDNIDLFLKKFISESLESKLSLGEPEIKNILEKISLIVAEQKNLGLGSLNRLFMAAELLHLKKKNWNGLRLCLIEELEAHLHPQAQMRVIETLVDEVENNTAENVQFILTSHSPNLSSKVKLQNLILCKDRDVFPLGEELLKNEEKKNDKYTKLSAKDYKFLERFLDVTKANLFYSKGVILVEGWSEEILLPILAKKLGYDLTMKEVSIINVGSTAYLHFAKIFLRNDGKELNVPVSIITDLDNRPDKKDNSFCEIKKAEKLKKITELREDFNKTKVLACVTDNWTLEWCLYKSETLSELFKSSVREVHRGTEEFKGDEFGEDKFIKKLRKDTGHSPLDKVEIASVLAEKISKADISIDELEKDTYLKYIIDAIIHACDDN